MENKERISAVNEIVYAGKTALDRYMLLMEEVSYGLFHTDIGISFDTELHDHIFYLRRKLLHDASREELLNIIKRIFDYDFEKLDKTISKKYVDIDEFVSWARQDVMERKVWDSPFPPYDRSQQPYKTDFYSLMISILRGMDNALK